MNIFDNQKLSLQAKGLFMVFYNALSEKDGEITQKDIERRIKEGKQGFRTSYNELKNNGYLTATREGISYRYRLIIDPERED